MRGADHHQSDMFGYLSPEQRVRKDHPLLVVRAMTDEILGDLSSLFDSMYAECGRPSIPPEKLLRAQLLQMLYWGRRARLAQLGLLALLAAVVLVGFSGCGGSASSSLTPPGSSTILITATPSTGGSGSLSSQTLSLSVTITQ
jgi:hypothetical protein